VAARLTLELDAHKAIKGEAAGDMAECKAGMSTPALGCGAPGASFALSALDTQAAGYSLQCMASVAIAVLAAIALCCGHYVGIVKEVKEKRIQTVRLERELHLEFGEMVKVGESGGDLGFDFAFQIFDTELDQETVRLVKVQCPGVQHADVEAELIFNGCNITMHRRASRGVEATTWKKRFQFRPSDGLFEFKEEQMQLESGFLHLVFRAYSFQNRIIRFPLHFSMAASDTDPCWEYSADDAMDRVDDADAWWHEHEGPTAAALEAVPRSHGTKNAILKVEVDTISTASTARASVKGGS
jgi:hypothetical protein